MSEWLPHGVGKLAGTMLGVGVAQRADAQRFARGRAYQRQGAVVDVVVEPGRVHAVVQGGRSDPYVVEIVAKRLSAATAAQVDARPRTSAQRYTALVPDAGDLRFSCTCPDWDDPCKHAVAVVVELGEQVARDPRLLERWRDAGSDQADLADQADPVDRAGRADPVDVPAVDPELEGRLGAFFHCPTPLAATPAVSSLPPPRRRWDQPWVDILTEALETLSAPDRRG